MSLIVIDHHPSQRQLRVFGLTWLAFFAIFGCVAWTKYHSVCVAGSLWGVAAALPLIGWFVPELLRIVFVVMGYAAFPIGLVVSFALLASIYYIVLTPIGLIMRLTRYDPMSRKVDRAAKTYWVERPAARDARDYFRQY